MITPDARVQAIRERAESLWEELGGDLCVCQRADVLHWCENCQRRIDLIQAAFTLACASLHAERERLKDAEIEDIAQENAEALALLDEWHRLHTSMAETSGRQVMRAEAAEREQDEARAAYAICEVHQPDRWEGDGTCVICEGQGLADRLRALSTGGPLDRYGVQWVGPQEPIAVPMPDGYWTPWHIAQGTLAAAEARYQTLEAALKHIEDNDTDCICRHDTDDCCANVVDADFCPSCYAHGARAPQPETPKA